MILDTSFLIDIEASEQAALDKATEIEDSGLPQRVPTLVVYEMFLSVGKGTRTEENRRTVERVLGSLPCEPATESLTRRAGILDGELMAADERGDGIGPADAVIAATALEYGEPVVTGDPTDFERVPDVEIERY